MGEGQPGIFAIPKEGAVVRNVRMAAEVLRPSEAKKAEVRHYHALRSDLLERDGTETLPRLREWLRDNIDSNILSHLEERVARYHGEKDFFANKKQAEDSDHNVLHGDIVTTLSLLTVGFLKKQGFLSELFPSLAAEGLTESKIAERAMTILGISGALHDSQRLDDIRESYPYELLIQHGIKGASKVPELIPQWSSLQPEDRDIAENTANMMVIQTLIRYHDSATDPAIPPEMRPMVELFVFADRMTLQRLFDSKHWIARFTAPGISASRLRTYKSEIVALNDPQVIQAFSDIACVIDILSHRHMGGDYSTDAQGIGVAYSLGRILPVPAPTPQRHPAPELVGVA